METIGLIAAMPQESNALLRHIPSKERVRLGALNAWRFELYEHNCVLVTSGMGIRRASFATRELISEHKPQKLISFGIAGAVEENLEIGDVVVIEAVYRLERGKLSTPQVLDQWADVAVKAAAYEVSTHWKRLMTGTAITTGGSQISEDLAHELKHPVLEMETAGIAQVAAEAGVPLLALRAISDGPSSPIPFNLDEMMDENANLRLGRLLLAMIRYPKMVVGLSRMAKNSRMAADNAAIGVIASIGGINS